MTAFRCALVFAAALAASPAAAEDADSQAFAGGQVTISETADGDRILAFDGQELARDWFVGFDRAATVAGTDILLYSVGPGGNACGPDAVIVWKPDDGAVRADRFGDCGAPPAANDGERLVFLPWVAPGEAAAVTIWTPADGFRLAGRLAFATSVDSVMPNRVSSRQTMVNRRASMGFSVHDAENARTALNPC